MNWARAWMAVQEGMFVARKEWIDNGDKRLIGLSTDGRPIEVRGGLWNPEKRSSYTDWVSIDPRRIK